MLEAITGILGAGFLGVVAWAFNISSEVKVLKSENESLEKLLDAKLEPIHDRLDRIERTLNGHLR